MDAPTKDKEAQGEKKGEKEPKDMERSIREQVEFYLSPKNLIHDEFLLSKMDNRLRVPLQIVAGFNRVKSITTDLDVVEAALKSSSKIKVEKCGDESVIMPLNIRPALRTTIILRDIPKDTPEDEVRALFDTPPKKVWPDIQDTWFCLFDSEEETTKCFEGFKSKTFKGQPIKGRVKTENLQMNIIAAALEEDEEFVVPPDPYALPYGDFGYPPRGVPPPYMYYGGYPPYDPYYSYFYGYPPHPGKGFYPQGRGGRRERGRGRGKGAYGKDHMDYAYEHGKGGVPSPAPAPIDTAEEFPSLELSGKEAGSYQGDYVKYSRDKIISILGDFSKRLANGEKPPELDWPIPKKRDCTVILDSPRYELELQRPVKTQAKAPTAADVVRKGGKSKAAEEPSPSPAVAEEKATSSEPKPTQASLPSPGKSWAEAAITAKDVKQTVQPHTQYKAGIKGETITVVGGASQKPPEAAGRGRGGRDAPQGRGGKKGGKAFDGKGDRRPPPQGKGKGKGEKGSKNKGQAADRKPAKEKGDEERVGSWAEVAIGLTAHNQQ